MKSKLSLFLIILTLCSCEKFVDCLFTYHSDLHGKQLGDGQVNVQYTDHATMYVSPTDTVTISNVELIGAPNGLNAHFSQVLSSSDTYYFVFTGTPTEQGSFTFQISFNSDVLSNGETCSKTKISSDFQINILP